MNQESFSRSSRDTRKAFEPVQGASDVLTIYSMPNCMGCKMTARALEKAGVKFNVVDLTTLAPEAIEAFKADGLMRAPIVKTGEGETWSGYRPDKIKQAVQSMPAEQVDEALAKIYEARTGNPLEKQKPATQDAPESEPGQRSKKPHR